YVAGFRPVLGKIASLPVGSEISLRPPAQFALQIGNGGLGGAAGAVWSRAAGAEQGMMEQSAAARLAADSLIGSLCFPPLVRISPVGMADPLDQRGFFGVQFPCPLDG